jgi:hypothetical protein
MRKPIPVIGYELCPACKHPQAYYEMLCEGY